MEKRKASLKITICKKVEVGNPCKLVGNFSFKQVNDSTFKLLASSSSTATYGIGKAFPGGTYRAVVVAECIAL